MSVRSVKLVMVTPDNHNKFYNMADNGDGKITVNRGRVGVTDIPESHPISKWDALYKSKVKKGYKDVTHLFTEAVSSSTVSFSDISDRYISELIAKLEAYTKKQVATDYLVTADSVTQKQIDQAQVLLNELMAVQSNRQLNKVLLEVFATIPRKMKKVQDHLFEEAGTFSYKAVEDIIAKEQDLLDTMAQQVNQVELVHENKNDKLTLLDAMGLVIVNVDKAQEQMIKGKMGMISDKYRKAFKVEHKKTSEKFKKYVSSKSNKKTELLWHGSRSENILPILQSGLLIRPTNAIHSGSMFDDGIYGANKAIKSYGYTSGRNSIWARGTSNEAFMFLFDFHLGEQYVLQKWESWMSRMRSNPKFKSGNYDSVYAKGGADLKNDEFIVYTPDAVTVSYLVELVG